MIDIDTLTQEEHPIHHEERHVEWMLNVTTQKSWLKYEIKYDLY